MSAKAYEHGLERNAANYTALTPVSFLAKAASVYPDRIAVIHGKVRRTWRETYERSRRLASALVRLAFETEQGMASPRLHLRRAGRVALLACTPELAEYAERLGHVADAIAYMRRVGHDAGCAAGRALRQESPEVADERLARLGRLLERRLAYHATSPIMRPPRGSFAQRSS